mmetsp:Transcript_37681/g.118885  ORF Transcript_37681/g.118885 Transcript_37681/m.118885 type:complete len:817 (-) Transcript_37681:5702-8152(-)
MAAMHVEPAVKSPRRVLVVADPLAGHDHSAPHARVDVELPDLAVPVGVLEGGAAVHEHLGALHERDVLQPGVEARGLRPNLALAPQREVGALAALTGPEVAAEPGLVGETAQHVHGAAAVGDGHGVREARAHGGYLAHEGPLLGGEVEAPDVAQDALGVAAAVHDHAAVHHRGRVVEARGGLRARGRGHVHPLLRAEVERPHVVKGVHGALASEDVHVALVHHARVRVARGGRRGARIDLLPRLVDVDHGLVGARGRHHGRDDAVRELAHGDLVPHGVAGGDAGVLENVNAVAGGDEHLVQLDGVVGLALDDGAIDTHGEALAGGGAHGELVPLGGAGHRALLPVGGDAVLVKGGERVHTHRGGARVPRPALGEEALLLRDGGLTVVEVGRDEVRGVGGVRVPEKRLHLEGVEGVEVHLEHALAAPAGVERAPAAEGQLVADGKGALPRGLSREGARLHGGEGAHHVGGDGLVGAHHIIALVRLGPEVPLEGLVEVEDHAGVVELRLRAGGHVAVGHLQVEALALLEHAAGHTHVDLRGGVVAALARIDVEVEEVTVVGLREGDVVAVRVHAPHPNGRGRVHRHLNGHVVVHNAHHGHRDLLMPEARAHVVRVLEGPDVVDVLAVRGGASEDEDLVVEHLRGVLVALGLLGDRAVVGEHAPPGGRRHRDGDIALPPGAGSEHGILGARGGGEVDLVRAAHEGGLHGHQAQGLALEVGHVRHAHLKRGVGRLDGVAEGVLDADHEGRGLACDVFLALDAGDHAHGGGVGHHAHDEGGLEHHAAHHVHDVEVVHAGLGGGEVLRVHVRALVRRRIHAA